MFANPLSSLEPQSRTTSLRSFAREPPADGRVALGVVVLVLFATVGAVVIGGWVGTARNAAPFPPEAPRASLSHPAAPAAVLSRPSGVSVPLAPVYPAGPLSLNVSAAPS